MNLFCSVMGLSDKVRFPDSTIAPLERPSESVRRPEAGGRRQNAEDRGQTRCDRSATRLLLSTRLGFYVLGRLCATTTPTLPGLSLPPREPGLVFVSMCVFLPTPTVAGSLLALPATPGQSVPVVRCRLLLYQHSGFPHFACIRLPSCKAPVPLKAPKSPPNPPPLHQPKPKGPRPRSEWRSRLNFARIGTCMPQLRLSLMSGT